MLYDVLFSRQLGRGTTPNALLNDHNNRKIETVFIPDYEKEALCLVKKWEQSQE